VRALEPRTLLSGSPVLSVPAGPFNVVKTTQFSLTVTATDATKGLTLTFSLVGAPTGAGVSSTQTVPKTGSAAKGVITWTPTEDQGPTAFPFTVKVTASDGTFASKAMTVTTLADGIVGNNLLIVGTSTNQGTTTNPGNDVVSVSAAAGTTSPTSKVQVTINGATSTFTVPAGGQIDANLYGGNDSFTLDESTALITPATVVDGGTGTNTVTENGTTGVDAFGISSSAVSLTGAGTLTFANTQSLIVNGLGGNDTFAVTGVGPATTVNGGAGSASLTGTFATGFTGSLTVNSIPTVSMQTTGDFNGSLAVNSPGSMQTFSASGTVTATSTVTATNISNVSIGTLAGTVTASGGSITGTTIGTIAATGLLQATETAGVTGTGVLSNTTIGTNSGSVAAGSISGMSITSNFGSVGAAGQGTTTNVTIGTNAGKFTATEKPTEPGSGVMSNTSVGSNTGTVSAGAISGMSVTSNGGSITAAGQGTTTNVSIGTNSGNFSAVPDANAGSGVMNTTTIGTNSGTVSAGYMSGMSVTSNAPTGSITTSGQGMTHLSVGTNSGTIHAVENPSNPTGTGIINNATIGTNSGTIAAGTISMMSVSGNTGSVTAHGQGTITNLIMDTNAGIVQAVADTTAGSGALSLAAIGTLTPTGQVIAATATGLSVGTVAGTISVTNTLNDLTATNVSTTANLSAGHFNIVSASGIATAGLSAFTVNLIEPTVTRSIALTVAPPTPAGQTFALPQSFGFYYNATGAGDPVVTLQVNAGGIANVRYDLGLLTNTVGLPGSGIDLAGIYALGAAGIRNLTVAGSVQPGAANPTFFGLPATTPGGVQLPQDVVAVAVAGSLPAASIVAAGVPALAFGSAAGISATVATHTDALVPLAVGTALVQANDTYKVFAGDGVPVAQFLVTGPGGTFDAKGLLFTDQVADNRPITASVTLVPAGSSTAVQEIDFTGNGAALQTSQPVTTTITDLNGALGDVILSAPQGITANITAASIIGSILATKGAISGVIQTTSGDLGRAITDASGNILSVTSISAGGGGITATGQILSAGNLISAISVQSGMDGIIAANGDIGVIQLDSTGVAVGAPSGALTRFGGITVSTGGLDGEVIALGNIFGDIVLGGGLGGRIAAQGKVEYGLPSYRFGILGNVAINGGISKTGAIVSAGLLGDNGTDNINGDGTGTLLTISGTDKGLLAAVEDINFGTTGSLNLAGVFENVGTPGSPQYDNGNNAAVIDAIFSLNLTPPVSVINTLDLQQLVQNLLSLGVGSDGNLTGP
jgi:hypothetical protein